MTSYIARHGAQKKKGILEKREVELVNLLKADTSEEKQKKERTMGIC
ncbi:MAG: hypothetical protein ACJAQT_002082 [Akkermansiaceae bacterium]|jgi:hypothetical protein